MYTHTYIYLQIRIHIQIYCNTLQHTAAHCNTMKNTAAHCNTLQHTATHFTSQHLGPFPTDAGLLMMHITNNTVHITSPKCLDIKIPNKKQFSIFWLSSWHAHHIWNMISSYQKDDIRSVWSFDRHTPLTEEIRLSVFGSPDYPVFLSFVLSAETPFTPVKTRWKFGGFPWKRVWMFWGLPWKLVWNIGSCD